MKKWILLPVTVMCLVSGITLAEAADRAANMQQHRGGTLKLLSNGFRGTIDPQIAYDEQAWQIHSVVYDQLLTYQKADDEGSNVVVPDLAEAMPEIRDNGATYVFKLRKGIKFSDGRDVTVKDVVASYERMYNVHSPTSGYFYQNIVGAKTCLDNPDSPCSLAKGVIGNPDTSEITIHLNSADGEFINKAAMFHATVLPADTPQEDLGTNAPIGTGPYMIVSYDPATGLKAKRNPHFKQWSEEAQPDGYVDEIEYTFGADANSALNAVLNDQADWMFQRVPPERLGEISTNYSNRAHIHNEVSYWLAPLNTQSAPFNNEKVRQAINYATDRAALVDMFGGPNLAKAVCNNLPIGIPGHEEYCDFTKNPGKEWTAPDLEKAKQLVEESGTKGTKVTIYGDDRNNVRQAALYFQGLLKELGYDAEAKILSESLYWPFVSDKKNNVQIAIHRWMADYPQPGNFIGLLFNCNGIMETGSLNLAQYCNKDVDSKMSKAMNLLTSDPDAAYKLWSEIDREITATGVSVPLYQAKLLDVFSSRVGGDPIMFSRLASVTLSSLWVQ